MSLGVGEDHSRMIYHELLHINPIRMNLTFIGHEQARQENSSDDTEPNPRASIASMLLAIPEKLVPNVDNAPISLKSTASFCSSPSNFCYLSY